MRDEDNIDSSLIPPPSSLDSMRPRRLGARSAIGRVVVLRRHQLPANGAEDSLIGRAGEIDKMLTIFVSVECDDESIDTEGHGAAEEAIFRREVLFAQVRDGIEQAAVANIQR